MLPTSSDLVTDLPADFDVALQGVDTRLKALNPETTLGDIAYASATANTNTRRAIGTTGQVLTVVGGVPAWSTLAASSPVSATATVATTQGTSSTSYTDLATAGPAVTVTTGTKALVIVTGTLQNGGVAVGQRMSFAVSGATTLAASDANSAYNYIATTATVEIGFSRAILLTGLTAGSNTFTTKYKATSAGTIYFGDRSIIVMDMGS